MLNFKIGDTIECVDTKYAPDLTLGRKYVVNEVRSDLLDHVYIRNDKDVSIAYYKTRFKKVNPVNEVKKDLELQFLQDKIDQMLTNQNLYKHILALQDEVKFLKQTINELLTVVELINNRGLKNVSDK